MLNLKVELRMKRPNKQVKIARCYSLGLLKSGAMLRFLIAPYLSRYVYKNLIFTKEIQWKTNQAF